VYDNDDDCFYYHSWRNNVVIAFGTLSSAGKGGGVEKHGKGRAERERGWQAQRERISVQGVSFLLP